MYYHKHSPSGILRFHFYNFNKHATIICLSFDIEGFSASSRACTNARFPLKSSLARTLILGFLKRKGIHAYYGQVYLHSVYTS